MTFDLIIRNASCVTADARFQATLCISDGRIEAITQQPAKGRQEVDATGFLVLPGGVEPHCHLEQRSSMGVETADDFHTGTVSALRGGTTTVVPFICQHKGESLGEVYRRARDSAAQKAVVDYSFHLILTDPSVPDFERDHAAAVAEGINSFKVFLTYDMMRISDAEFLRLLEHARAQGLLMMVHAESSAALDHLSRRLIDRGSTAPPFHAVSRPPAVEREAVHRALSFGEIVGASVYIVHVSSAEALNEIRAFRTRGVDVLAETCPQYLFLSECDLDRPGLGGIACMFSPPARDAASREALWRGVQSGFDVFASDHAPYRLNDPKGKLIAGPDAPFNRIPNGIPGIETRLALLFSEGVMQGRIDLHRFVELTATNPARIFGMFPRKGTICVGADADLVFWDTAAETIIRNADLHHAVDYTPYEGMPLKGRIAAVYARGELLAGAGAGVAPPGRGRFLRRGRYVSRTPNLSGSALDAFQEQHALPAV